MSWEQLNKAYSENGVVLALGAGVSVGSRLPTWTELLRRVSPECGVTPTLVADLQGAGFGLPANRARTRTIRHFAILPRFRSAAVDTATSAPSCQSLVQLEARNVAERELAVDLAVERSLANLGTTVLWASPDEIPERLERMYAAGSHRWKAV